MNKALAVLELLFQGKEIKLETGKTIRLFKAGETVPNSPFLWGVSANSYFLGYSISGEYTRANLDLVSFLIECDLLSEEYIERLKTPEMCKENCVHWHDLSCDVSSKCEHLDKIVCCLECSGVTDPVCGLTNGVCYAFRVKRIMNPVYDPNSLKVTVGGMDINSFSRGKDIEIHNSWGFRHDPDKDLLAETAKNMFPPSQEFHILPSTGEKLPYTGTHCSVCGEPQYSTPSGVYCKNGHGGADSIEDLDNPFDACTSCVATDSGENECPYCGEIYCDGCIETHMENCKVDHDLPDIN